MLVSVSIFAALTGFLMGYDMCIVAVVLDPVDKDFHLCGSNLSCSAKTLFVSILAPGAVIGSIMGGFIADKLGRRPGLLLSDICLLIAALCFGIGATFPLALFGRFCVGTGVGIGFVVYATYMCEIAPSGIRGILVACQEVAQCCGCMIAYVLAAVWGGAPWRLMMGAAGIIAAAQILGELWILPESPRFLVRKGRLADARESIRKLGNLTEETEINEFIQQLKQEMEDEKYNVLCQQVNMGAKGTAPNAWAFVWHKYTNLLLNNQKPILIAVGCAVAQNLTAANSVVYFAIDIFKLAGVCDPYLAGAGVGAMKFVGVVLCMCLVERLGRRNLLIAGTCGAVVCHILIGTGFLMNSLENVAASCGAADKATDAPFRPITTLLVVGMLAFMFFWNISWAALMFVVASEVLPNSCRGVGMGLTITTFWIVAFLMQTTLEPLFGAITTAGTFYLFAGLSVLSAVFVVCFVPEGSGVVLEQLAASGGRKRRSADESTETHAAGSGLGGRLPSGLLPLDCESNTSRGGPLGQEAAAAEFEEKAGESPKKRRTMDQGNLQVSVQQSMWD